MNINKKFGEVVVQISWPHTMSKELQSQVMRAVLAFDSELERIEGFDTPGIITLDDKQSGTVES